MRKKKNSKLRSALAIFLAGAMVLGMIPGGMGQVYASDSTPTPAVAFDETSVSDPSTVDTWNQVVKLENKADFLCTVITKLLVIHARYVCSIYNYTSACWHIHPSKHIKYSRFSRS